MQLVVSAELGADVMVHRNDAITVAQALELGPTHVVISPGPGHPSTDAGVSKEMIRAFEGKVPVFGMYGTV
jgi:anthranilate synthase/indole-3-glycerol phosphate synthase/phosphoribosylanthranilate isomerase